MPRNLNVLGERPDWRTNGKKTIFLHNFFDEGIIKDRTNNNRHDGNIKICKVASNPLTRWYAPKVRQVGKDQCPILSPDGTARGRKITASNPLIRRYAMRGKDHSVQSSHPTVGGKITTSNPLTRRYAMRGKDHIVQSSHPTVRHEGERSQPKPNYVW